MNTEGLSASREDVIREALGWNGRGVEKKEDVEWAQLVLARGCAYLYRLTRCGSSYHTYHEAS